MRNAPTLLSCNLLASNRIVGCIDVDHQDKGYRKIWRWVENLSQDP
jgi:hypothetical protein